MGGEKRPCWNRDARIERQEGTERQERSKRIKREVRGRGGGKEK